MSALYEAALHTERWKPALDGLAALVGADACHVQALVPRDEHPRLSILSERRFEDAVSAIDAHFGTGGAQTSVHWPDRSDEVLVHREPIGDAFVAMGRWRDTPRPLQDPYVLSDAAQFDEIVTAMDLLRAVDRGAFGREDVQRAQLAWAHVRRAIALYVQTEDIRHQARLGRMNLDQLDIGLVSASRDGRVAYVNAPARAILAGSQALRLDRGRLRSPSPAESDSLARALRQAIDRRVGSSQYFGRHLPQEHALYVSFVPSSREAASGLPDEPGTVLLMLRQRGRQRMLTEHQLIQIFRLSPAEARFARAMAQGMSPEEYSQHAELSINTVRSHQRKVYDKTGTSKATQLIRLLASIPPIRSGRTARDKTGVYDVPPSSTDGADDPSSELGVQD